MKRRRRPQIMSALLTNVALTIPACSAQDHTNTDTNTVSDVVQECMEPAESQGVPIRVDDLVGEFEIELHVSFRVERDSLIRGLLTLARRSSTDTLPGVLFGWTTVSEDLIGDIDDFVTALSSKDPMRPGVVGFVGRDNTDVVLLLGAAGEGGIVVRHAGIILRQMRRTPDGLHGLWGGGGQIPGPSGFFCAWRRP